MAAYSMTTSATTPITKIWKALGNIDLAVAILLAMAADLTWGFFALRFSSNPFRPLNDLGLWEWAQTYGRANLGETLWFFMLLALLFLLAVNTFVCTTIRVDALLRRRATSMPAVRFALKLAPHVMHYAVILMLLGALSSYLFTETTPNNILTVGANARIRPTDYSMRLEGIDLAFREARPWNSRRGSRAVDANVRLALLDANGGLVREGTLSLNHPLWFKGCSIHLKDFDPQTKGGGMGGKPHVNLIVRKDPGIRLYLAGTFFFVAGLSMYVCEWIWTRWKKEERP
ncbi:MAG: hypothetical protein AB7W37_16865 [Syntrophobacteraceae bacterium]